MAVLKNKTAGNYICVSQVITHDHGLSLVERGLLLTLLSLPDNWHLTVKGLQQILPDGKDRITNALNGLIDKGYVTKEQERGEAGKFATNILEVHDSPMTGNPVAENPPAAKPPPENRPQDYKYISNNQEYYKHKRKPNPFNQYEQHTYDYEALEKALICN